LSIFIFGITYTQYTYTGPNERPNKEDYYDNQKGLNECFVCIFILFNFCIKKLSIL